METDLAKVGVVGSNPIARSSFSLQIRNRRSEQRGADSEGSVPHVPGDDGGRCFVPPSFRYLQTLSECRSCRSR
jgi:hypothetical protein